MFRNFVLSEASCPYIGPVNYTIYELIYLKLIFVCLGGGTCFPYFRILLKGNSNYFLKCQEQEHFKIYLSVLLLFCPFIEGG